MANPNNLQSGEGARSDGDCQGMEDQQEQPLQKELQSQHSSFSSCSSIEVSARGVTFFDKARVRKTLSRHNFSQEEKCGYWYNPSELRELKREAKVFRLLRENGIDLDHYEELSCQ